jgi:FkbM family methyltransferase
MPISTTVQILAWIGNRIGKPPGWERIVRTVAAPEKCRDMPELCLVRDELVFLAQPSVQVGWHVTFFGTYEPELREIFRAVLHPRGIAIDVGANVGWHTLLMARLVGPAGRVLAIEPNASVRRRLEDNVSINRLSQVAIIPSAMSDADEAVDFYGPAAEDAGSGSGHIVRGERSSKQTTVPVDARRLDAIVADAQLERLDLIKIDVEGLEWAVLHGGEQTIAKFRPFIVFEYDARFAARGGGTPRVLADFFVRHGYRLFAIGRNWAQAVDRDHWPDCSDLWAIPCELTRQPPGGVAAILRSRAKLEA